MNYYDLLEVSQRASEPVIRAAYKSLIQRYHPDRNPNNPAIAEKAALVVQAYRVLSDESLRADYDRSLAMQAAAIHVGDQKRSAPNRATSHAKSKTESRPYWLLGFVALLLVVSGWLTTSIWPRTRLLNFGASPPAELKEQTALPGRDVALSAGSQVVPVVRGYLVDISVPLRSLAGPGEERVRILTVPVLDLRVGRVDPENAIRHLKNMKTAITQTLYERLSLVSYQELISRDGEAYLSKFIVNAISDASGTNRDESVEQSSPDRYGVIGVDLPRSYSVN